VQVPTIANAVAVWPLPRAQAAPNQGSAVAQAFSEKKLIPKLSAPTAALPVERQPQALPVATAGTAVCPVCNTEMAADAVLCVKCGFNQQTGKKLDTVRERRATATLHPPALVAALGFGLGIILILVGAVMLLFPMLLWAILILVAGVGLFVLGYVAQRTTYAKVTVTKPKEEDAVCQIFRYCLGLTVGFERLRITPLDQLVLYHEVPASAVVWSALSMLSLAILRPGTAIFMLGHEDEKRSYLVVRHTITGKVQPFATLWSEDDLRRLIDTIQSVVNIRLERGARHQEME
jgi:hypothetical protein